MALMTVGAAIGLLGASATIVALVSGEVGAKLIAETSSSTFQAPHPSVGASEKVLVRVFPADGVAWVVDRSCRTREAKSGQRITLSEGDVVVSPQPPSSRLIATPTGRHVLAGTVVLIKGDGQYSDVPPSRAQPILGGVSETGAGVSLYGPAVDPEVYCPDPTRSAR